MGGIQKSLVNLLNHLDYERFEVDLYLFRKESFWEEELPEKLRVRVLKPAPRLCAFLPFELARRLIRYDFGGREYDLAVDFNSYQVSCAAAALSVPARKRVMWVHNDVERKLREEWKYRVLWHFFKGKFRYYDEFVCVSAALEDPFRRMSGMGETPCRVIQNYIDVPQLRRLAEREPEERLRPDPAYVNLAALGRLCRQKGYDVMLEQFRLACGRRDDLRLYIIGDGPERAALEKRASDPALAGRVFFLGSQPNPFCLLRLMDGFVSSSRYEGQPLNLMEARALGLPLYCTANLERYCEGLRGTDDLAAALAGAKKAEKRPESLESYDRQILDSFAALAEE